MRKYLVLFAAALTLATWATVAAAANIVLDLNPAEGDQGIRSAQIKPGEVKDIEVVAQSGAQDIAGFEIVVKFDTNQFNFKGFQPGGIMTGAISLPVKQMTDGVTISVGFLGNKSAADRGSLGKIQIEASQNLTTGGKIALTRGAVGISGKTTNFPLNSEVSLTNAAGKTPGTPPQDGQPSGMGSPPGPPQGGQGGQPGGMGSPPGPPQGGHSGQPNGMGAPMGPPQGGSGGPQMGPPSADQVFKKIDTNQDGMISPEEFAAWFQSAQGPGMGSGKPGKGMRVPPK